MQAERSLQGSGTGSAPLIAGSRNSFLDAVRAIALVRIIVWHTYGYVWLSYLIASMPAMFFVAGSLMAQSLQRGNALHVLHRRFRRIMLPFWVFAAVALVVMSVQADGLAVRAEDLLWWLIPVWDPTGTEWGLTLSVPLWYLRCLTWLLVASPILLWLWRRTGPGLLLLPLGGLVVMEAGTLPEPGLPWQFKDAALYGFFWMLGFAYADGLFARLNTLARGAACAASAGAAAAWVLTHDVPGGIVNLSYPLHLFVGLAWLFGALTFEQTIARIAAAGWTAAAFRWLNQRALTVYLWQTAGLLTMYQILWTGETSSLARALLALPIVASVTFVALQLFGWVEDFAGRRGPIVRPPARSSASPRFRLAAIAGGTVAVFGLAAIVLAIAGVARDPSTLVQASAHTVPPSGAGLHYRAQTAVIVSGPPVRTTSGRTEPVFSEELQAELEAWLLEWGLPGAAVTLRRETGETWTGTAGVNVLGEPLLYDEQYWIASVTKTFTSALILRLAEAELLTLDDLVSKFVPDFPFSDRFTIRQLLQHTSGLTSESEEPARALIEAAQSGLQFEPGTRYLYSRAGYFLLALIVEDIMGASFTSVLNQEILAPLQLTSTAMDEHVFPVPYSTHPFFPENAGAEDSTWTQSGLYLERGSPENWEYYGILWSAGGLWSTTSDLTRWALALWDSDTVVSAASLAAMTTFLDDRFDFTGLATYPFCTCWWDNGTLLAERWGFAGTTGILEFDPEDRVAIAVHITSTLFEENVIDSLEDLSQRLRRLIRARELIIEVAPTLAFLGVYLVEDGDTLYDIAARLGVPAEEQESWITSVIDLNRIEPDSLEVGFELKLP